MAGSPGYPTAYEILGVHSRAPGELISAAYWMTIEEIQAQRELGRPVDMALHLVTRAYENVAGPEVRAGYNLSIGDTTPSLTTRRQARRRWRPGKRDPDPDLYEVIGLHDTAPQELVREAYHIMRGVYLRVPVEDNYRVQLITWLEKARDTLGEPDRRARYDVHLARVAEKQVTRRQELSLAARVEEALASFGRFLLPWMGRRPRTVPQQTMFARLSLYVEQGRSGRGGVPTDD